MSSLTKTQSKKPTAMKPGITERLCQELSEFFAQRMAISGDMKVKIVDDLILLRCNAALSPGEVEIGAMKAGRRLVQEVSEKTSRELHPSLNRILNQITGLQLMDVNVAIFWQRKEKVFLLTMSDSLGNVERKCDEHV